MAGLLRQGLLKCSYLIFIRLKVMLILVVSNMYKKGDSFQMTFLFISTAEQNFSKSKKPLTFHRVISLSPRNRQLRAEKSGEVQI